MGKTVHIEQALILNVINGDRESQKRLYDLLFPYLFAIVSRYLRKDTFVDDVLQESFVRIFKHIDSYSEEKGSIRVWASRIAINAAINRNKKEHKYELESLDENGHSPHIQPLIIEKISTEELMEFLKCMPLDFFEIFQLHAVDGYSHKEISDLLGISEPLSRQRLSRARAWIYNNMRKEKFNLDFS